MGLKERLLLVLKVEGEGRIPARVAKELLRSRTWTSDWLARYRKEGINGLEVFLSVKSYVHIANICNLVY